MGAGPYLAVWQRALAIDAGVMGHALVGPAWRQGGSCSAGNGSRTHLVGVTRSRTASPSCRVCAMHLAPCQVACKPRARFPTTDRITPCHPYDALRGRMNASAAGGLGATGGQLWAQGFAKGLCSITAADGHASACQHFCLQAAVDRILSWQGAAPCAGTQQHAATKATPIAAATCMHDGPHCIARCAGFAAAVLSPRAVAKTSTERSKIDQHCAVLSHDQWLVLCGQVEEAGIKCRRLLTFLTAAAMTPQVCDRTNTCARHQGKHRPHRCDAPEADGRREGRGTRSQQAIVGSGCLTAFGAAAAMPRDGYRAGGGFPRLSLYRRCRQRMSDSVDEPNLSYNPPASLS